MSPKGWEKLPDMVIGPKGDSIRVKHWRVGKHQVLMGNEPMFIGLEEQDVRWHISISHAFRYPSWDFMVAVKEELQPDLFMAIAMPPRAWWFSDHPFCFHLWTLHDPIWVENMKANFLGAQSRGFDGHVPIGGERMR